MPTCIEIEFWWCQWIVQCRRPLAPGQHIVLVNAQDHEPQTKTITIPANNAGLQLNFTLLKVKPDLMNCLCCSSGFPCILPSAMAEGSHLPSFWAKSLLSI